MKYNIIFADPPWIFSDKLTMSDIKRGAESQYNTLTVSDIKKLPVQCIADDDSLLILWVPSSLLQEGLDVMNAWGFSHKQTNIWVKIKNNPFLSLMKSIKSLLSINFNIKDFFDLFSNFKIDKILAFGMGRLFRQTHEIALIGIRGNVYKYLKNKSQRSVHFGTILKHSAKPEDLQDMTEIMFPDKSLNKIELFARRSKQGWLCLGNESPDSFGEDIRYSLSKLIKTEDLLSFEKDLEVKESKINLITNLINDSLLKTNKINKNDFKRIKNQLK